MHLIDCILPVRDKHPLTAHINLGILAVIRHTIHHDIILQDRRSIPDQRPDLILRKIVSDQRENFLHETEKLRATERLDLLHHLLDDIALALCTRIVRIADKTVPGVGNRLNSVANIVIGAVSMAGATMMGQCFGARDYERIRQCHRACLVICAIAFVILGGAYLLFPGQIFSLFTKDPDVIAMAPEYMVIAVVWLGSMCSMTPPYAVIDGVGHAMLGLVISILDGVVARVGLCILLGRFLGLHGFWLGNALAGFVTTIMAGVYYYSGRWKTRKLLLEMNGE